MRRMLKILWAAIPALVLITSPAHTQDKKADWLMTAAHGATTVEFTTDEGTWMNLDVSPDGREIVFDLLGDIYIMPITGGTARALTSGPA